MVSNRVTIFGGSGFLGSQIVKCLAAEGINVRVAVRHPERASFLKGFARQSNRDHSSGSYSALNGTM